MVMENILSADMHGEEKDANEQNRKCSVRTVVESYTLGMPIPARGGKFNNIRVLSGAGQQEEIISPNATC